MPFILSWNLFLYKHIYLLRFPLLNYTEYLYKKKFLCYLSTLNLSLGYAVSCHAFFQVTKCVMRKEINSVTFYYLSQKKDNNLYFRGVVYSPSGCCDRENKSCEGFKWVVWCFSWVSVHFSKTVHSANKDTHSPVSLHPIICGNINIKLSMNLWKARKYVWFCLILFLLRLNRQYYFGI